MKWKTGSCVWDKTKSVYRDMQLCFFVYQLSHPTYHATSVPNAYHKTCAFFFGVGYYSKLYASIMHKFTIPEKFPVNSSFKILPNSLSLCLWACWTPVNMTNIIFLHHEVQKRLLISLALFHLAHQDIQLLTIKKIKWTL